VALILLLACTPEVDLDAWEATEPPFVTYDDSKLPRVDLPEDLDDLALPLEQIGEDSGEYGIVYSGALAGYYILRAQNVGYGEPFGYNWDPVAGEWKTGEESLARQIMATITLVRLYGFTGRDEFAYGAGRAFEVIVEELEEQEDGTLRLYSIGSTALGIMALTEYAELTGSTEYDEVIDGLAAHVASKYNDDGSWDEGARLQWQQLHKTLWNLYTHTGDEVWLDMLETTGRWQYDNLDSGSEVGEEMWEYPYLWGLWAAEPMTELYFERPNDWIAELVFFVGDDVVEKQWTPLTTENENWVGGYHANPPNEDGAPNWNNTLKLEAVADCYRLAEHLGDEERAWRYRRSALAGTEHLLRWQFRQGDTADFDDPDFPIGGMKMYVDNPNVRVDIPAHGTLAITKVADYLDLEDYPGRD